MNCPDCGRPFAKSQEEWFNDNAGAYPEGTLCGMAVEIGPSQCRIYTIKRLKAQVHSLEGALENYDTTDAENHAVEEVVRKLTRILDERRQVGKFGGESLQKLAERLLCMREVAPGCWCSDYQSSGIPCVGFCPNAPLKGTR